MSEPRSHTATPKGAAATRLAAALSLALLPAGCGGGGVQGEPWVELGTGGEAFEPLADGQDLAFEQGPQGGFHLPVALRAGGVRPSEAEVRMVTHPAGQERPRQEGIYVVDLARAGDPGVYEYLGLTAILTRPECMVDRELHLALELTDRKGRAASDARVVVPRRTEAGPSASCE